MTRRKVRLERPSGVKFDGERARRAVRFFEECLVHTKGRHAGKPFKLEPFQRVDIEEVFGRVDDEGNRIIRQYIKFIPKKNGKSEEAAGVANKLLFADSESSAEIYGAAADREQASIVFNVAASMVHWQPRLKQRARVIDSVKRIVVPQSASFYRAISADVAGKHGFNSHGVIFDELHTQQDTRLWEVLTFGAGAARSQPLTMGISTAGIPGESPVAEMLWEECDQILRGVVPCPPDMYPVMYAAEPDDPWDNEDVWRACNPAIGSFLKIESIREEFEKAKRRPSEYNSFLRLRLNRWVAQENRWIQMDEWDRGGGWIDIRDLRSFPCWIGIDLSTKKDITAIVAVFRSPDGIFFWLPWFYIPRDNLVDRPNMEAHKYRDWAEKGLLTTTPGNTVDFSEIEHKVVELRDGFKLDIRGVIADPAFAHQLLQRLGPDVHGFNVREFPQNYNRYTPVCVEFEAVLADGSIRHGGNPILRWMADNVAIHQRTDGKMMPKKPDRMKSQKRIDGIIAGLMATSEAMRSDSTSLGPCEIEVAW